MSKKRYAANVDSNQPQIVKDLLSVPGITVEPDHNDLIVGACGLSFWYEIKGPRALDKNGKVLESEIKPDQKRIRAEFTGHYLIVSSFEQIIEDIAMNLKKYGVKWFDPKAISKIIQSGE
ncbi:hypothetical protein KAR91_46705 [Candidatus Pacearchaeota archaeon]|nr:hypothetical protein [Candidatus Pacearchaeota archaeon]